MDIGLKYIHYKITKKKDTVLRFSISFLTHSESTGPETLNYFHQQVHPIKASSLCIPQAGSIV